MFLESSWKKLQLQSNPSHDHLPITAPFWAFTYSIKRPLNNDHLSTTATILGSHGWSLYTGFTVSIKWKNLKTSLHFVLLLFASGHVKMNALDSMFFRQEQIEIIDLTRIFIGQKTFMLSSSFTLLHLWKVNRNGMKRHEVNLQLCEELKLH